jgi:hypothetical protein
MWTAEHRRFAARKGLRYPSDLTDGEWALIEPMIPPAKRGAWANTNKITTLGTLTVALVVSDSQPTERALSFCGGACLAASNPRTR